MGQYHHVSKKYLPLYLAEFTFRFNNRKNPHIFELFFERVLASRGVKARKCEKHVEITDAELIERLREKAPEMLEAEIDFDKMIEKVSQAGIPQERARSAFMVSRRSHRVRVRSPKNQSRKP
jgi:hypothetical protein